MHPLKPSANQASQSARQTHQFLPLRAFHHPPTTTTITPLSNCPILSPPRGCELRARRGNEPLCPLSCSHLPLSRYLVSVGRLPDEWMQTEQLQGPGESVSSW